jgi:glycosyltransferase involved in cell wall biosynthesis
MKLSLVITTFNRTDMVLEAFEKVYNHDLIDEVIIVDDASTEENFTKLLSLLINHDKSKIKLFRNETNLGMSRNKAEAVSKAKNEWCILFDSDNILYPEYLDAVKYIELNSKTIYHPVFSEPEHNYNKWSGMFINKNNAKDFLKVDQFGCLLNNCNFIVNRDEYLKVYKFDPSIKESDSIYFNTLWLSNGNDFYIVPKMIYHHRKHSGSGWLNGDHRYNMNKAAELQEKIKNL